MVHAGLAWWWAPVFAAVIYAGSLEFLMVGSAAAGAPITATVALTTLIVNSRHVFTHALSFSAATGSRSARQALQHLCALR